MVMACDTSTNQLKVKMAPVLLLGGARLAMARAPVMTKPSMIVAHSSQEFSFRIESQIRYVWKTPITCASDTGFRA